MRNNRIVTMGLLCLLVLWAACSKDVSKTIIPDSLSDNPNDTTANPTGKKGAQDIIVSTAYGSGKPDAFGPGDYIRYFIKKGNNFCDANTYRVDTLESVRFMAILDSSCIYQNADPANQADINKLYGFSDSASHHQTNSARFGWNWMNGEMHIHAYCYVNKARIHKELGTVAVGKPFECELKAEGGHYVFTLNGKSTNMPRGTNDKEMIGYELLPYFGGDEPAPQDIKVSLLVF